jgi:hypothetical protein
LSPQVLEIIEQEIRELEKEKAENLGCPELCFIEQALELCGDRKKNVDHQVSGYQTL